METEATPSVELLPATAIRVETALSRYPVHRLARKGNIKIDVSERNGTKEAALKWKVSYNSEHGQPGPLAYKIDTLIINRRIEEVPRPIPRLIKLGSLNDICRELGVSQGKNIGSVKNALHQNASAYITARIQYKLGDGTERTLEAGFTRYTVVFTGEKLPNGRKADGVYIILNDVFIQVLNGAMTRPLDYEYLKSLPPAPQRFYELLSYQMYAALKYDRLRAKLLYSDLCAHAPLARYFDWEHVRKQLSKIHKPHKESGYIAKIDYQQTTDKDGQPDWIMLYMPGPKARAEFRFFAKRGGPATLEVEAPDTTPLLTVMESSPLVRELIRCGVTAAKAEELVRDHPEEKIAAQVERLDWLLEKKPTKIEEPAAYLVQAIKNDFAAPKGFVSAAERQRREEARQARERKAIEEQQRKRAEEAAKLEKRKRIDAYIHGLTPEDRRRLEAEALAATPEEHRRNYENPATAMFRESLLLSMLREHVGGLLANADLEATQA